MIENVQFDLFEDGEKVVGTDLLEHTDYTLKFERALTETEQMWLEENYHSILKKKKEMGDTVYVLPM